MPLLGGGDDDGGGMSSDGMMNEVTVIRGGIVKPSQDKK
jgi:hypothetical protein